MGAWFFCFDPAEGLDPAMATRARDALAGFAPFGFETAVAANQVLVQARPRGGRGHAWFDGDLVVLDGELANVCRVELRHKLAPALAEADDLALVHAAWTHYGESAGDHLHGRFALLLQDHRDHSCWLLRDALGERALHLRRIGSRILIASRASVLLTAAQLPVEENSLAIAAYFAMRAPPPGSGYFRHVQAIEPGEGLHLHGPHSSRRQHPLPNQSAVLHGSGDAETVACWRAVLDRACRRAVFDAGRPAIMLSGGIDSSALAVATARARPDLLACSWRLPKTPTADESSYIATTVARLGIGQFSHDGDGDWPLAHIQKWPVEDEAPLANPYRWLQSALFSGAAEAGAEVILSGNFGDHLYPDAAAVAAVDRLRRLLGSTWRRWRRERAPAASWLRAEWWAQQAAWQRDPSLAVLSAEAVQDAELGRRFSLVHGLDLRHPYRDPEVIAFMAALPANYSQRAGVGKWITREALRGDLPEEVRLRPKGGSLTPLFRLGVCERERALVDFLLDDPQAGWPAYLRPEALAQARVEPQSERDLLLIWLTIAYELWCRARRGAGPVVLASQAFRQGPIKAT